MLIRCMFCNIWCADIDTIAFKCNLSANLLFWKHDRAVSSYVYGLVTISVGTVG